MGVAMPATWARSTPAQIPFTPLKTKRLGQVVTMGTFDSNIIGSRIQRVISVAIMTTWPSPA